jgi:hypothetical protein
MSSLLLALLLSAWQPPEAPTGVGKGEQGVRTDGDNPLTEYLSLVGQYGVTFAAISFSDGYGFDSFVVSDVPPAATVARALVMTGTWDFSGELTHSINFSLNGAQYGTIEASTVDVNDTGNPTNFLDLSSYVIDVTAQVTGNGEYEPNILPNQSCSGPFASLLWVVYERGDLPWQEIQLNFGGESLKESSSSNAFTVAGSGNGTLHLFIQADQAAASQGTESVLFNGQTIACCQVFNGIIPGGSYLEYPVVVLPGVNSVEITTGEDWLGWHVSALEVPVSPVSAPPSVTARSWAGIKALYR